MFFATATGRTLTAADPRIHDTPITDARVCHVRPHGHDITEYLVAQHQTRVPYFQTLVIAEIEDAFVQMNVGVADATGQHLHKDLGALRHWRG